MDKTLWCHVVKLGEPFIHLSSSRGCRLFIHKAVLGTDDYDGPAILECRVDDKEPIRLCVLNSKHTYMNEIDIMYEMEQNIVLSVSGNYSIHLRGYYVRPHEDETVKSHDVLSISTRRATKKRRCSTQRKAPEPSEQSNDIPVYEIISNKDSSVDDNPSECVKKHPAGPSDQNGHDAKRPIGIDDENDKDDDVLFNSSTKRRRCSTQRKAPEPSEQSNDIPVYKYNSKGSSVGENSSSGGVKKYRAGPSDQNGHDAKMPIVIDGENDKDDDVPFDSSTKRRRCSTQRKAPEPSEQSNDIPVYEKYRAGPSDQNGHDAKMPIVIDGENDKDDDVPFDSSTKRRRCSTQRKAPEPSEQSNDIPVYEYNSKDSSVGENSSSGGVKKYRAGPSNQNGHDAKMPIVIDGENDKDDDVPFDSSTKRRMCSTQRKEPEPSEQSNDIPVYEDNSKDNSMSENSSSGCVKKYRAGPSDQNGYDAKMPIVIDDENDKDDDVPFNSSTRRTEGPPFIGNTEPQRIELQNTVVGDSGRPHSGDVPADKTTPGCELKIKDLKNGSADGKIASNGSQVTVKYVGELSDGKIIDPRGEYKFKLGAGCVIRGWELGILGMRVGGKRRLIIPPHLGYGAKGGQDGSVPPNSWLKYEIKLTNVEGCQEYDSSFVKQET